MAMLNLYKCVMPSCKVHLPNGKECNFVNGEYATDSEIEIKFFEEQLASGHPHIFVDKNQKQIDSVRKDPIAEIKAKAVAEYLAAQKPEIDTGTGQPVVAAASGMVTSATNVAGVKVNLQAK